MDALIEPFVSFWQFLFNSAPMLGIYIVGGAGAIIALSLWLSISEGKRQKRIKENIERLSSGVQEIPAQEFLKLDQERSGRNKVMNMADFTGIYIIHNATKNMYYVGQSKTVFKRLRAHLNGKGTVKTIPLVNSGYGSLDALERDAISAYDACNSGYNRNRGNRT